MTRAHLARRSAILLGALVLGLVGLGPLAAPSHALVATPLGDGVSQSGGTGCPVLGGYLASNGFSLDFPYVGGTLSGYGFGHGYPFYGTPYPVWGSGFGYVPYTFYPAVGTPTAGTLARYQHPINAYHPAPFPVGPTAPVGVSYDAGYPFPPTYPWTSYPRYGGQPIGAFLGFWDPFYVGNGAGRAVWPPVGC